MQSVLTLIAPEGTPLTTTNVSKIRTRLDALGAETDTPTWLCQEMACDISYENLSDDQAEAAVRSIFKDDPIDAIAQPTQYRRKHLLLADMDSTIVTTETLDDLAAHVGLKDEISAITARAMNGELDFAEALKERVMMLKDLPASALEDAYQAVLLSKGAQTLVQTMAAHGAHCVLVSGGFKYFTSRIAERCGFHEDLSNDFIMEDDKLTGEVTLPILDKTSKLDTLIDRSTAQGISLAETLCVGDGANDLPMLQAAGLGVAYRGKPSVRAEAPARLDHADLRGLLFAQGYKID